MQATKMKSVERSKGQEYGEQTIFQKYLKRMNRVLFTWEIVKDKPEIFDSPKSFYEAAKSIPDLARILNTKRNELILTKLHNEKDDNPQFYLDQINPFRANKFTEVDVFIETIYMSDEAKTLLSEENRLQLSNSKKRLQERITRKKKVEAPITSREVEYNMLLIKIGKAILERDNNRLNELLTALDDFPEDPVDDLSVDEVDKIFQARYRKDED